MELKITAREPWRSLCLTAGKVKLCASTVDGHPVLRRVPGGRITATVTRTPRTLTAQFSPVNAGLPYGTFHWTVGGLPRRTATARLLAEPRCYGAAAEACDNPALHTTVEPTPEAAQLIPAAPCDVHDATPLLQPCYFGAGIGRARQTVALLGDSHAEQFRAALDVVAQARRWRVIALTRAGCPFSTALAHLSTYPLTDGCRRSVPAAARFLSTRHVTAVFVSAHDTTVFTHDAVAGYRGAWNLLPETVKRIYVLRDTPHDPDLGTFGCVDNLIKAAAPTALQCAVPREQALTPDPEADAARGAGPRVRLIDLSALMCTDSVCPPVIGGALVLKDADHLTRAFSYTLGPYLLNALRPG